jgi:hypothetical protein
MQQFPTFSRLSLSTSVRTGKGIERRTSISPDSSQSVCLRSRRSLVRVQPGAANLFKAKPFE